MDPILQVKNLKVVHKNQKQDKTVLVEKVSFNLKKGEVLGFVGESGCGKTVSCLSITRLHTLNSNLSISGEIVFDNKNILDISEKGMQDIRGNRIGYVFQDPSGSLNPCFTIGNQIKEVLKAHNRLSKSSLSLTVDTLLKQVAIQDTHSIKKKYPHELSGGQAQRICLALALAGNPELLIADEPTTALDAVTRVQIIELIKHLIKENNLTVVFVSHDLELIQKLCQQVLVLYGGAVLESGFTKDIMKNPLHPYTQGLSKCTVHLDKEQQNLSSIEGTVPTPANRPKGCRFHPRCSQCFSMCREKEPPLFQLNNYRSVRCWLFEKEGF
ncbi:MAG: ABC transporter ATP-binding protein [Candidatus Theseobacter exili]|nr:ABC transporter ATP-binding protein [Candidatus Theseobacter exili]